jgi:hypothetical protein
MSEDIAGLFEENPNEVESELSGYIVNHNNMDIEPLYLENANIREVVEALNSSEFQHQALKWIALNPSKSHKLAEIFTSAFEQPPANGILLRRSALITLVSFMEQLFEDLFRAYFTLKTPTGSGSTSEWIEKQVDKAMKGELNGKGGAKGFKGRLDSLSSIGIDLKPLYNYFDYLQEVTQRRNLFVHQDGIIDQNYIDRIPTICKSGKPYAPGRRLIVSTGYLNEALEITHLFGAVLVQLCWRAWGTGNHRKADLEFGRFVFSSLRLERYSLVRNLDAVADFLSLSKETRQVTQVNHGIVLRECGEFENLCRLLEQLVKSRPGWKVKIAISVLKEDYNCTHRLLDEAAKKDKLGNLSKEWPLFKPIAKEEWFVNEFKFSRGKLPLNSK